MDSFKKPSADISEKEIKKYIELELNATRYYFPLGR